EGRSRDTRGLHRFGHRRSEFSARTNPGSGYARQCQRDQCDGAADEHVRLRQQLAVHDSGPRHIHYAIRSLLGTAGERVSRSQEKTSVIGNEITEGSEGRVPWPKKNSSGPSPIATSGRSVTSTTARRP